MLDRLSKKTEHFFHRNLIKTRITIQSILLHKLTNKIQILYFFFAALRLTNFFKLMIVLYSQKVNTTEISL